MSSSSSLPSNLPEPPAALNSGCLVRAFASFTEVAGSLERSYTQLQSEVSRLRHELEARNHDLAASLEENGRIRRHLNHILEGLPCGVLVTEADGSVSIVNPETRRLLGIIAGAAGAAFEPIPVWVREMLEDAGAEAIEREYQFQCQGDQCQGTEAEWVSVRRARLPASEGGSAIFILRDISQAKRLEAARESLRNRQALAEMSALLAHEIRNPLGSLELFAGLLAGSDLGPERRQWAEQLQAGLRTLAATVNNVLHFHSQPPPALAPTDLGRLLRSLVEFLRPLAEQASVRLELSQQLDGAIVAADRHRLEQVVLNLGLNAFRFMPQGGTLRISGSVAGGMEPPAARIEFRDTGQGIAPENLESIFQPGFTTRPGSPGLGLVVCRTILEQHGGEITVASRPGSGTTFALQLPLLGAKP